MIAKQSTSNNQYYIYINKNVISWNIHDPNPANRGFVAYFGKVLQQVEQRLQRSGLTFYVTMTEMDELPSYGDDVVVFILGDEFYRVPKYCHKVGAIFKCYGTHQVRHELAGYSPLLKPSYLKVLMLAQSVKNMIYRLPLKLNHRFHRFRGWLSGQDKVAPVYDIPPGYYNSCDLPIKDFEARRNDVFFDGSVIHSRYPLWSLRYWSKTPKAVSREQMALNLEKFKEKYPQFHVQLSVNFSFAAVGTESAENGYVQNMMDTKICLVPRGTTLESYRFFEAMRYGCIIVTEVLPPRWFYDGSPVIQIADWQNLERILKKLLEDKELMQVIHQQTLDWWETKCSEAAVGKYVAEKLNGALLARSFETK